MLESLVEQESGKKLIINRDFSPGFPLIKINLFRSDQNEHLALVPSDSLEPILPKPIPTPSTLSLDQVEPDSGDCLQSAPSEFSENHSHYIPHRHSAEQHDVENAQTGRKYPPFFSPGSGAGKQIIAIQAGDRLQPKHPRMVGRTAAVSVFPSIGNERSDCHWDSVTLQASSTR